MLVYRTCMQSELFKILDSRSFDNIGKSIDNFNNRDRLYLCFYDNFDDVLKLNNDNCNYVCVYDIPEKILINSECYHNVIVSNLVGKKYIIPIKLLSIKYFLCYEEIKCNMLISECELNLKKIK